MTSVAEKLQKKSSRQPAVKQVRLKLVYIDFWSALKPSFLLAICRGAQEVNVALGGSLHQAVQELPAHADHRAPAGQPGATQYGPAHAVAVQPGGLLAA